MNRRMGISRCCCADCRTIDEEFSDFNPPFGTVWAALEGDFSNWTNDGNRASISTANQSLKTVAGVTNFDMWNRVKGQGSASGDQLLLITAIKDSLTHYFLKLALDTVCGGLSLWRAEIDASPPFGPTLTQLGASVPVPGAVPGAFHELKLCLDTCPDDSGVFSLGSGQYVCDTDPTLVATVITSDGKISVISSDDIDYNLTFGALTGFGVAELTGTALFDTYRAGAVQNINKVSFPSQDDQSACPPCKTIAGSCVIIDDPFDRSDSSDLGCLWEKTVGDARIENNQLKITTAAALMTCLIPHPRTSPNWRLTQTIKADASGSQVLIILDKVDNDNFHFVEITFGVSGTMKFYKRSSGSDSQIGPTYSTAVLADTPYDLSVCLIDTLFTAHNTTTGVGESETTTPHGGQFCGVGTGALAGGAAIYINDFVANRGFSSQDPSCEACKDSTDCLDNCLNGERSTLLKLTFKSIQEGVEFSAPYSPCGALCLDLNRTVFLTSTEFEPPFESMCLPAQLCAWWASLDFNCGPFTGGPPAFPGYDATIVRSGDDIYLQAYMGFDEGCQMWRKKIGTSSNLPDCNNLDETLPWFSGPSRSACEIESSTVRVVSI